MPITPVQPPAERLPVRQIALWSVFTALVVLGVVLYFGFADRFAPLLDSVIER